MFNVLLRTALIQTHLTSWPPTPAFSLNCHSVVQISAPLTWASLRRRWVGGYAAWSPSCSRCLPPRALLSSAGAWAAAAGGPSAGWMARLEWNRSRWTARCYRHPCEESGGGRTRVTLVLDGCRDTRGRWNSIKSHSRPRVRDLGAPSGRRVSWSIWESSVMAMAVFSL